MCRGTRGLIRFDDVDFDDRLLVKGRNRGDQTKDFLMKFIPAIAVLSAFSISSCGLKSSSTGEVSAIPPAPLGGGSAPVAANSGGSTEPTTEPNLSGSPNVQPARNATLQAALDGIGNPSATGSFENAAIKALAQTQMTAIANNSATLVPMDVQMSNANPNDGQIEVAIDGVVYNLTAGVDATGKTVFTGMNGSDLVDVFGLDEIGAAAIAAITFTDSAGGSAFGFTPSGSETPLDVVSARGAGTGVGGSSAFYNGNSYMVANRSDGGIDTAEGTVTIFAQFDSATFDASMDLRSAQDGTRLYDIGDTNISLIGQINGNKLSGTFLIGQNTLGLDDAAPIPGTLEGGVYGEFAETVAGNFTIAGKTPGLDPLDIVVQGGFIGAE